jgi:hypothetical protein
VIWPDTPYLPGVTPRPADPVFAPLKATLAGCETPEALAQSPCFRAGFVAFERGYYWEAHELWEPVWMALPDTSPERALVQGLIQLANAALKRRMGREKAALRIMTLATEALARAGTESRMGLGAGQIAAMQDKAQREVQYTALCS